MLLNSCDTVLLRENDKRKCLQLGMVLYMCYAHTQGN
jgi:hypothetical protein